MSPAPPRPGCSWPGRTAHPESPRVPRVPPRLSASSAMVRGAPARTAHPVARLVVVPKHPLLGYSHTRSPTASRLKPFGTDRCRRLACRYPDLTLSLPLRARMLLRIPGTQARPPPRSAKPARLPDTACGCPAAARTAAPACDWLGRCNGRRMPRRLPRHCALQPKPAAAADEAEPNPLPALYNAGDNDTPVRRRPPARRRPVGAAAARISGMRCVALGAPR